MHKAPRTHQTLKKKKKHTLIIRARYSVMAVSDSLVLNSGSATQLFPDLGKFLSLGFLLCKMAI